MIIVMEKQFEYLKPVKYDKIIELDNEFYKKCIKIIKNNADDL